MGWREQMARHWRRNFSENVWMALDTLRNHKLRSALTLLGITVAVTTLIAVVAILLGLDRNIRDVIQGYGTNTAFFSKLPSGFHFGRPTKEERMRKPISYDDFLAVRQGCTACVHTTVSIFPSDLAWIRYKGEEATGLDFRGATGEFFSVYANAVVKRGRPFTEAENLHRLEVAVLGEDVAKGLFATLDPLGKDVIVDGHNFTVIGVFEKPRGGVFGPGGDDLRVVVPYWTFRKIYPNKQEHGIRIEAAPDQLALAVDETRVALRRNRKVVYDKPDGFSYATSDSIIRDFHNIVGAIALAITVIASIGLMIGGVGVMNIMLVSVTERTREIGVRKAIGARRRDITWQFLTEAMVLAGAGGLAGVVLGYAISSAVRQFVPSLPTFVPLWAVMLGIAVAMSVGLFFGIYPAVKAARLEPIVALRYE
jgi:putative ABC transport system permease protein